VDDWWVREKVVMVVVVVVDEEEEMAEDCRLQKITVLRFIMTHTRTSCCRY
jgi:hypothetical protein